MNQSEDDCATLYLIGHLGDALEASIRDNILRNEPHAVAGVTRLYELMRRVYTERRELIDGSRGDAGRLARHWLSKGRSAENIIRWQLEHVHKLPMSGISDREIASYAPRFRGRLRDFQLASCHSGGHDRLAEHYAHGGMGSTEATALVAAGRFRSRVAGTAQVIQLADIRRAR